MKAVIIAGGKGSRMGKVSKTTPKALLEVADKTILEFQLEILKANGFKQVFILTNYLGDKIEKFCLSRRNFGLNIIFLKENEPVGTAGAVKLAQKYLTEDFLVIYGDEMLNMDLKRMIKFHNQQKKLYKNFIGTLAVHKNDHPLDSDLVEIGNNGLIKNILPKPHPENLWVSNLVSTPVYILTPKIFKFIEKNKVLDFGRQIFPKVVNTHNSLAAYQTPEYIKDIGTPKRLKEVLKDVKTGKFSKSSLKNKRPAIFLDRDGVINKEVGNLRREEDFVLLPGAAKAIRKINQSGYYAVVTSNQPVVAKGFCNFNDVLTLHKKMETLLGAEGTFLDAIYFCPHHPDKGFPGENKKYKIECECRKPKLGMLKQATKELNIDIKKSYMVGDRTSDVEFARRGGLKFVGVKTGDALKDGKYKVSLNISIKKNLFASVKTILTKN